MLFTRVGDWPLQQAADSEYSGA